VPETKGFLSVQPIHLASYVGSTHNSAGNVLVQTAKSNPNIGRYTNERDQVFYLKPKARLFCRSWMALVSFRRERALIVFLPFLKFRIAHSASPVLRERPFVVNSFAAVRISSRYSGRLLFRTRGKFHRFHLELRPGPSSRNRGRPSSG
jgi:hypothetical protein